MLDSFNTHLNAIVCCFLGGMWASAMAKTRETKKSSLIISILFNTIMWGSNQLHVNTLKMTTYACLIYKKTQNNLG